MIIIACLAIGLAMRLGTRTDLKSLESVRISGEAWLVALLLCQAVAPALHATGPTARLAYYGWLSTFPLMAAVAWTNRRFAGMSILCAGLAMNFLVIAVNGGMPVFVSAAALVRAGAATSLIPQNDFVHVLASGHTWMPWLADVIPLPGPSWLRAVASPGDVLLFAGVMAFLGGSRNMRHSD